MKGYAWITTNSVGIGTHWAGKFHEWKPIYYFKPRRVLSPWRDSSRVSFFYDTSEAINQSVKVTKTHSFCRTVFSLYENKVLQLMSAGAILDRFGEKDLLFINWRFCKTVLKMNGLYVLYVSLTTSALLKLKVEWFRQAHSEVFVWDSFERTYYWLKSNLCNLYILGWCLALSAKTKEKLENVQLVVVFARVSQIRRDWITRL